jgi:hypothetical protein
MSRDAFLKSKEENVEEGESTSTTCSLASNDSSSAANLEVLFFETNDL